MERMVCVVFQIKNEFKHANLSRTIRFTDSLYEELKTVAARHNMSLNELVLRCCRYALDHLDETTNP